jgi:hypothetical protein
MGTQQPVPEPENLEELSDAELDSRINEARRQAVDQARSIRRRGSEL